ncbi:MAG: hypothetical protein JWO13_2987 [Acidobacteriales bacterium]|nr:hypothetical protein [Terriglobales bacterium]
MNSNLKALQGTWEIVTLEYDGQKMPCGGAKIVVKDARFVSLSMGAEYEGTVSFDESSSPKTFDMNFDKGPHKGNKSLGIYEIDGDTWKICIGFAGKSRPTKFETSPGSGHALETLRREV